MVLLCSFSREDVYMPEDMANEIMDMEALYRYYLLYSPLKTYSHYVKYYSLGASMMCTVPTRG